MYEVTKHHADRVIAQDVVLAPMGVASTDYFFATVDGTEKNRLAPPMDPMTVHDAISREVGRGGVEVRPYGDGDAAIRIVETLAEAFIA